MSPRILKRVSSCIDNSSLWHLSVTRNLDYGHFKPIASDYRPFRPFPKKIKLRQPSRLYVRDDDLLLNTVNPSLEQVSFRFGSIR